MSVPSNLIPTRISQLPVDPNPSLDSWLMVNHGGVTCQVQASDLVAVSGVPTSRQVIAGTGLTGGGALSANVTLSIAPGGVGTTQLASTGVTEGSYGSSSEIPVFTVDAKGRITAASSEPLSTAGLVPATRQVIAGDGLTGGGNLNSNVTLSVDYGSALPLNGSSLGVTGSSLEVSRSDHQHPAVELAEDDQVNGVLGLDNGGTGASLTPVAGGFVWSGGDHLYVGAAGEAGQVLVSGGSGAYSWGSAFIISDQAANIVYAGPASGGVGPTSFRSLVTADIPTLPWSKINATPTTLSGYGITDGQPLNANLTAISGISGNGLLARTGAGTAESRSVTASSAYITVTNGDGVAGNPTVGLTYNSTTIGTTPVLLGGTSLTLGGLTSVTVTQDPLAALDLATKQYVDTVAQGLSAKTSCVAATTVNLVSLSGLLTLDGVILLTGQRVLVKNQSAPADNGIYLAAAGSWTRALDMNVWAEVPGAFTFIESGAVNASTGWTCTAAVSGTIGTTAMSWTQFSGAGTYSAGTGLTLSGAQFSLTNTAVSAATYGSASAVPVISVNAQGQITGVIDTTIVAGAATNLVGGAASQLAYQTGASATGFIANGAAGQILTSNGASAPSWSDVSGGTF